METNKKLLTQKKLAKALGLAVSTVCKWKECPRIWLPQVGKKRVARYVLEDVLAWLEEKAEEKGVEA